MKLRCQTYSKILVLTLLTFLSVAVGNAHTHYSAYPGATQQGSSHTLGQTRDDRPSWQDVGLQDLLVPGSQNVVEAPHTVASAGSNHGSGHGGGLGAYGTEARSQSAMVAQRVAQHTIVLPARASDYYLFYLSRLRL